MKFISWPSIENHYNRKFVNYFLELYPELAEEEFIITEKLHGSNFQFAFAPNEDFRVASRKRYLDKDSNFQGVSIFELMERYSLFLQAFQNYSGAYGKEIRLYGELIGPKIQKGIYYGKERQVKFFGMRFNDELVSWKILEDYVPEDLLVPIIGKVTGLETVLGFSTEFKSRVAEIDTPNICEGIVIQPFSRVYRDLHGVYFLIKKKNEAFLETKKKLKVQLDSKTSVLHAEFESYLTEERLDGIFSKLGNLETTNQFGEYIKAMITDAKADFEKDFSDELAELDKKELKGIFKVGGDVARMLQERMTNV